MLRKLFLAGLLALLAGPSFAASAYISEFSALGRTSSGTATAQIATLPSNADQKLDFSGGVQSSAAFNAKTYFIRVHCDAACSVNGSGTATTSNMRIPADGVEYFAVLPGSTVSVISSP
jgi:opacity protein-like surface antigen